MDERHLNGIEISRGGDMRGSKYFRNVSRQEDGRVHIHIESAPDWRAKPSVKDCVVDGAILAELEGIYVKYNIKSWQDLPNGPLVHDGATTMYRFDFGEAYFDFTRFGTYQALPDEAYDAMEEIDEVLSRYMDGSKK